MKTGRYRVAKLDQAIMISVTIEGKHAIVEISYAIIETDGEEEEVLCYFPDAVQAYVTATILAAMERRPW